MKYLIMAIKWLWKFFVSVVFTFIVILITLILLKYI